MIKVMDLGLGRTGTMSLKLALEELGFSKCYHFSDMRYHPEHTALWLAASRGEWVDWESIFQGYQSTVYWSPTYDYQQLLRQYPDIKVVLTVRDPEQWYTSTSDTIYAWNRMTLPRKIALRLGSLFKPEWKNLYALWQMQEEILWQKTFHGRFHDKAYAIKIFTEHIASIKQNVPGDRLLVHAVQEGWEPLCQFLETPMPDISFPCVNDSMSFIEWRKNMLPF